MDEVTRTGQVSRREVLKKGLLGAAGLTVLPTVLAACSNAAATPTAAPVITPAPAGTPEATPAPGAATPVPPHRAPSASAPTTPTPSRRRQWPTWPPPSRRRRPSRSRSTPLTTAPSRTRSRPTSAASRKTSSPGSPASGCGSSPPRASRLPIDDVWTTLTANYSDAFKVGSTGDDGHQYFVPIYNYPWAVFYRKSLFAAKGYTVPHDDGRASRPSARRCRRTSSSRSPSPTRTAGRRWARSTSSTSA